MKYFVIECLFVRECSSVVTVENANDFLSAQGRVNPTPSLPLGLISDPATGGGHHCGAMWPNAEEEQQNVFTCRYIIMNIHIVLAHARDHV